MTWHFIGHWNTWWKDGPHHIHAGTMTLAECAIPSSPGAPCYPGAPPLSGPQLLGLAPPPVHGIADGREHGGSVILAGELEIYLGTWQLSTQPSVNVGGLGGPDGVQLPPAAFTLRLNVDSPDAFYGVFEIPAGYSTAGTYEWVGIRSA